MEALVAALKPVAGNISLEDSAVGFDANTFLRLNNVRNGVEATDYLSLYHRGPLVVPGQVVQEFWNNQHSAYESGAKLVEKAIESLNKTVGRVDNEFTSYVERLKTISDEFSADLSSLYSGETMRRTLDFLDVLNRRGEISFVPRMMFSEVCSYRKSTKTPPGFEDKGDGDFFVWADFLLGLIRSRTSGSSFGRVLFISNEKKPDWMRGEQPHPILSAEIAALLNVPFEIWDLDKFRSEVRAAITRANSGIGDTTPAQSG